MRIRNPKHARRFCRKNMVKFVMSEDKQFVNDFKRAARFVVATETKQTKFARKLNELMWTR